MQQCIVGKGLALGSVGLSAVARRVLHFLQQETGLRHPTTAAVAIESLHQPAALKGQNHHFIQQGKRILGRHLNSVNG